MEIAITNPSAVDPVHLGDFNYMLPVSTTLTRTLPFPEYQRMARLHALVEAGTVTVTLTPSTAEEAAGVLAPPLSVEHLDIARVAASAVPGVPITFRKSFTAAVTGAADDVTIFAADALPYKFRVLDVYFYLSTVVALSTAKVWTRASGAGTAVTGDTATSTAGRVQAALASNATVLLTPATLDGLFLRRGDRAIAGEIIIVLRRET